MEKSFRKCRSREEIDGAVCCGRLFTMDFNPEYVRLWTCHQAEIGRYVLTMIPREDVAGEVLQDVAVRLWEKWAE